MTHAVRAARAADVTGLVALAREVDDLHARIAPGYFRAPEFGATRRAGDFERLLDASHVCLLVAEREDQPIGFVVARLYDTPTSPTLVARRRIQIDDLVVAQSARRQGVGRSLVEAAHAWGARQKASELVLTLWRGNDGAKAFYEAMGFATVAEVMGRKVRSG